MTDTTPHGHGDDHRPDDTTPEVGPDGAAQQAGDAGASTPSDSETTAHGHDAAADSTHDADHTDVIEPAAANPTEQFGAEQHTDQYTAPYPTTEYGQAAPQDQPRYGEYAQPTSSQAPASAQDQSGYGQQSGYGSDHTGQYGQHSQYGQAQSDQYGQTSQYGQANQYGEGQSQYGQSQSAYGQSQSAYGQNQSQYGQSQYGQYGQSQNSQYGQSQYGQSQDSQYGQNAYGQSHQSAPAPSSAFGDTEGSEQRANGYYFTGAATGGAGAAAGASAASGTATKPRANRNKVILPLVGGLIVGALVGGAAGGGWVAATSNGGGTTTSSSSGSNSGGNLTVNDYNSATVVTAVAAQATPSVVTINVSSSSEAGTGSGVVMSKDGYIVTNTHVVTLDGDSGNGTIQVTTSDGKIYPGKLVGTDPTVDLAVVKIDATDLKPMTFADSSKLNVGDTAVAIGAPLGLSNTVTDGIVSTLNRSIQVTSSAPNSGGDSNEGQGNNGNGPFDFWGNGDNGSSSGTSATVSLPVIQTDASINPGNSGGALLDSKGKLIGINVAIASAGSSDSSSSQSGSIGVGFSIPANLVKRVATEIIDNGSATHGLLGATVGDASEDANATQMGALIKSVSSGGAAAGAGLQKGDVVTKIGDATVSDATDLTAQVRYFAGGAKTQITYLRNGESRTADVTLGTYDSKS